MLKIEEKIKIEKFFEEHIKCKNCGYYNLVSTNIDLEFICSHCGYIFDISDLYTHFKRFTYYVNGIDYLLIKNKQSDKQ